VLGAGSAIVLAIALYSADGSRLEAKAHFEEAEKNYRLGRFDEALSGYSRAYELMAAPDFLFNIGQCHRNLGDLEKAVFYFEQYVRDVPSPDEKARVELLIADLRREIDRKNAEATAPPAEVQIAPPITQPQIAPEPKKPAIYERWWFWSILAVAAAGGVTAAVLAGRDREPPPGSIAQFDFR
jgi:tetratricopeptide (TPR) repeat protein